MNTATRVIFVTSEQLRRALLRCCSYGVILPLLSSFCSRCCFDFSLLFYGQTERILLLPGFLRS